MEKLKTALFGYDKQGVVEYVARLNETFSDRVLETTTAQNTRIRELEEKITRLENENLELRRREREVSMALVDAKFFAEQLKANAQQTFDKELALTHEKHDDVRVRIDEISEDISALQKVLYDTMGRMKVEMDSLDVLKNKKLAGLENTMAELEPEQQPAAEPAAEPAEEIVVEPTEQPTEEVAAEVAEETVAEPTERPAEEAVAEPTEQPAEETVAEPTEQPTEEAVTEPAQEEPVAEKAAEMPEQTDSAATEEPEAAAEEDESNSFMRLVAGK